MADANPRDWSPADNPYAIAVSEAQWWRDAARLAVFRMRDDDDRRIAWFSSRQIDARQLIFALRQLLAAEHLQQMALAALGIDPAVGHALTEARARFEQALPDITHMRDGLVHFDEWSRGTGKFGPQRKARDAGLALPDVAREYWGFGYDPGAGTVSLGPFRIHIDAADHAARDLCHAIYLAARAVDEKDTAELRTKTTNALTAAGIAFGSPSDIVTVSPGSDLRVWLSLSIEPGSAEHERREISDRIADALATAGLHLVAPAQPEDPDAADRLTRGEALYVEPDA